MRRLFVTLLVVSLLVVGALALGRSDDDEPVDPRTAGVRRAIAVALEVVPGRVTGVARDRDDGNWEVTVRQDGRDFEVELRPHDLTLLGIDYD
jgi:uncharacterized membrane protein YkoI